MRYEIVHDTLARQILDRVSGQAKARRQAELLVTRAFERYQSRGILLTQDDLDEIRPHEDAINFSPEEKVFIQNSKRALERAAQRKRRILIGVISLLSVFLVFAMWQWQRALASTRALEAKAAYDAGHVSKAFRLAQKANTSFASTDTEGTVNEVLTKIATAGLERDIVHDHQVNSIDVSPSEEYILSTTTGQQASIWDLQGKLYCQMEHVAPVLGGAFLPWDQGRRSLTIAQDSTAYFWDGAGKLIRKHQLNSPIAGYAFNTTLKLSLLWGKDGISMLADTGEVWSFYDTNQDVINAAFSPNGDYFMLATADSVRTWFLKTLTLGAPPIPRPSIQGPIRWANYIASDQINLKILVQYPDSSSRIFNEISQPDSNIHYQFLSQELAGLPLITRFDFSSPQYSRPKILFQTDSTSIRFWSAYRKKEKTSIPVGNVDFYTRYDLAIIATRFSKTDRYLLTASGDGRVDIWNIEARTNIERFLRFRALIRSARFAQNDRYLITTAKDKTIKIWNLKAAKPKDLDSIWDKYDRQLDTHFQ